MPECTVTIQNNSGMPQNYTFFADAPDVQRARNISQCVYAAQRTPPNGSITIQLNSGNYAMSCNKQGDQVYPGQTQPVKLADKDGKGGSVISFDGERGGDSTAPEGCFKIICGRGSRGQAVGFGAEGSRGINPIAVWDAEDNITYTVHPSNTFNVVSGGGDYRPGTVIDAGRFGSQAKKIDLTRGPLKLTHGPDGRFN